MESKHDFVIVGGGLAGASAIFSNETRADRFFCFLPNLTSHTIALRFRSNFGLAKRSLKRFTSTMRVGTPRTMSNYNSAARSRGSSWARLMRDSKPLRIGKKRTAKESFTTSRRDECAER
jgi:hypothetical protein